MSAPQPVLVIRSPEDGSRVSVLSFDQWGQGYRRAAPERREELDRLVRGGTFERDGLVLKDAALTLARQRLLRAQVDDSHRGGGWANRWDDLHRSERTGQPMRMLIPGLVPWGWVPMLGGPPKVGKTKVVANYSAALALPAYRLFDHFEPATLTEDERARLVVVINAETPSEGFEEELRLAGVTDLDSEMSNLRVIHLEDELGGPGAMDLTDPAKFAWWVWRLTYCDRCDGDDDFAPVAVVVDGVTAILKEEGKSTAMYSDWYAAFRRLLRTVGTPNGLATGHTFATVDKLLGGVESMAGPDGIWTYTADNPVDADDPRWFSVMPRSVGPRVPRTRLRVNEDGRLQMAGERSGRRRVSAEGQAEDVSLQEAILAYVGACNDDGRGPTWTEVRAQALARNPDVDAALTGLVESERLATRPRRARGGGREHWVPNHSNLPNPA